MRQTSELGEPRSSSVHQVATDDALSNQSDLRGRTKMVARIGDERSLITLLALLALLLRMASALMIPPWQSPDEPKHFEYVRLLVDKRAQLWSERRILRPGDASSDLQREIIASMAENHFWQYPGGKTPSVLPTSFSQIWPPGTDTQLHRPSVYYFVAAPFLLPFGSADLETQLLVVRVVSALLGAATVVATYLAARGLAQGDRFVSTVSAAFVATLPMHVFIGGAANNDNLLSLFGSLFFLTVVLALPPRFGLRRLAAAAALLILTLATKRAAAGLLPAFFLTLVVGLAGHAKRIRTSLVTVALSATSILILFGVVLMMLLRQGPRLFGLQDALVAYALDGPGHLDLLLNVPVASPEVHSLIANHLVLLFESFWGILGWFNIRLGEEIYFALALVSMVSALGFLSRLAWDAFAHLRHRGDASARFWGVAIYALATGTMVALAEGERLPFLSAGEIPQGRYLFVAVTPIAVLFALGLRTFLVRRIFGTRIPALLCILALVMLDAVVYTRYVGPFYDRSF